MKLIYPFVFINENVKFLLNNRNYLLPKFYIDFFNLEKHFPMLTLVIVFFLSHFSHP